RKLVSNTRRSRTLLLSNKTAKERFKMNIEYKNAGTGAISYAKEFIDVKDDRNKAMDVISDLLAGKLHDPSDKRIKRCAYCNYYYRDKTRPNNSKTCSKDCKTKLDTERRASKR